MSHQISQLHYSCSVIYAHSVQCLYNIYVHKVKEAHDLEFFQGGLTDETDHGSSVTVSLFLVQGEV